MGAVSTIRWLLAIVFISLTGVTLFGATNYYNNPLTNELLQFAISNIPIFFHIPNWGIDVCFAL